MVRFPDGALGAHWLRRSGSSTYSYDVAVAVSRDDGNTWSGPFKPHRDTTKTEHGFGSFFIMRRNAAGFVWLDGRNMTQDHSSEGGHGAGAMTLRMTTVDREAGMGSETELDDRVCECCPTAAVTTPNAVLVAYRNRSADEIRDIQILRFSNDRWEPPFPIRRDGWQIPGCPVNGPALSSRGSEVAAAWFTAADGDPRVFVSFSHNEGKSFGSATRADDGKPLGRVALTLLPDGSALVGWIEYRDGRAELLARRVWPDGRKSAVGKVTDVSPERASGYPRLVFARGRIFFAWTETEPEKRIKTAIATLR